MSAVQIRFECGATKDMLRMIVHEWVENDVLSAGGSWEVLDIVECDMAHVSVERDKGFPGKLVAKSCPSRIAVKLMRYYALYVQTAIITEPFMQDVEPTMVGIFTEEEIEGRIKHYERFGQIAWVVPCTDPIESRTKALSEFVYRHLPEIIGVGLLLAACIVLFVVL